jgi:hypothetical protein
MNLRRRHACWVIITIFIAGSSHAGRREAIRDLDFATFRIDLLPFEFTVPRYEFTHCASDLYPTIDVIEARIEKSNGESWAHVYQMLAPEEGGSVACAATELNVHEYCYRKRFPQSCGSMSLNESSIEVYRIKPDQNASPEHLYMTIDGTLVVFAFDDKITWDEIGQALEAMESMTRVTPGELLSYKPQGAVARKLQPLLDMATNKNADVDRIPFTKYLPKPRPGGFDRIQGYAYWNKYGLEFQRSRSGEHSQLRIEFSETARSSGLKTCWSERDCDIAATTPKGRKIYSMWTHVGSSRPRQKMLEYYLDLEGTLVILSWHHWKQSEGKPVFRRHEFAPNELEALIDSLEIATSSELARFPHMSIMGSHGGGARGRSSHRRVIEKSGTDIEIVTPSAKTDCIRILEDGSVEVVGSKNRQIGQNGGPRRCAP